MLTLHSGHPTERVVLIRCDSVPRFTWLLTLVTTARGSHTRSR